MKFIKYNNFTHVEDFRPDEIALVRRILMIPSTEYSAGGSATIYEHFLYIEDNTFKFFTGLVDWVLSNLENQQVEIEDKTTLKSFPIPVTNDILDGITLRDDQVFSIKKCLQLSRGIVDLPTRTGKTEVFCGVSRLYQSEISQDKKILIIEDQVGLMRQTAERMALRGVQRVGLLGDGETDFDSQAIVCTIDTLYNNFRKGQQEEFFKSVGAIIVDECHHMGAESYLKLTSSFEGLDLLLGFSGTPLEDRNNPYKTPRDVAIMGVFHKVIVRISPKFFIEAGIISEPNVFFLPYEFKKLPIFISNYGKVYERFIVSNKNRNEIASHVARYCYQRNLSFLISINQIMHGKKMLNLLSGLTDTVFSYGDNTNISLLTPELQERYSNQIKDIVFDKDISREVIKYSKDFDLIKEVNNKNIRALIGSSVFDEGRDIPSLDGAILLAGGSSYTKTIQRPARALTKSDTRSKSFIIDFEDNVHIYLKNHSNTRKRLYEENYYNVSHGISEFIQFLNSL